MQNTTTNTPPLPGRSEPLPDSLRDLPVHANSAAADDPLSPDERRLLLEEIAQIGLTLGKDLLSTTEWDRIPLSPAHSRFQETSPLARLDLLVALWPSIETALACVAARPAGRLQDVLHTVPLPRTRGGRRAVQEIARTPDCAAEFVCATDEIARIPEHLPGVSYDTPENRCIQAMLQEIEAETGLLAALAEYCGEHSRAVRARQVYTALGRWQRRFPFGALSPLIERERIALLRSGIGLNSAPHYRALGAHCNTLQRTLRFDWSHSPLLRLPSLQSWHLYEIWCFLTLATLLRRLGWRPVESDLIRVSQNGLHLSLTTGQDSRLIFARTRRRDDRPVYGDAKTLMLTYRPLYPSANQHLIDPFTSSREAGKRHRSSYRSLSHAMQPDMVLEYGKRLYLLDAKYRSYHAIGSEQDRSEPLQPSATSFERTDDGLLQDLDKMHAYRDAIVCERRPAVRAAWCLFPGESQIEYAIIAYPSSTSDAPFGTAGIGALRLRPGGDHRDFERLLASWLS